jgi:hypothetical protein
MFDVTLVNAICNILYPFISLYAWYRVHKYNNAKRKEFEYKFDISTERINGRLDELIEAREKLAREEGHKAGLAEGILIGQRRTT